MALNIKDHLTSVEQNFDNIKSLFAEM